MSVNINTHSPSLLGDIVRFHRRKSELSIKELADLAGVGKTVVFDIEHGKESIRFNTLKKIFHALNISIQLEGPLMHAFMEGNNEKS